MSPGPASAAQPPPPVVVRAVLIADRPFIRTPEPPRPMTDLFVTPGPRPMQARPASPVWPRWQPLQAAIAAALIATLLGACSKPEPPAAPDVRPLVSGESISFPGDRDPPSLRIAAVAAAADQVVRLPWRLAWSRGGAAAKRADASAALKGPL